MSDFFVEQGVLEKHSLSYGSRKQRSYAEKESFLTSELA